MLFSCWQKLSHIHLFGSDLNLRGDDWSLEYSGHLKCARFLLRYLEFFKHHHISEREYLALLGVWDNFVFTFLSAKSRIMISHLATELQSLLLVKVLSKKLVEIDLVDHRESLPCGQHVLVV